MHYMLLFQPCFPVVTRPYTFIKYLLFFLSMRVVLSALPSKIEEHWILYIFYFIFNYWLLNYSKHLVINIYHQVRRLSCEGTTLYIL